MRVSDNYENCSCCVGVRRTPSWFRCTACTETVQIQVGETRRIETTRYKRRMNKLIEEQNPLCRKKNRTQHGFRLHGFLRLERLSLCQRSPGKSQIQQGAEGSSWGRVGESHIALNKMFIFSLTLKLDRHEKLWPCAVPMWAFTPRLATQNSC